MHIMNRVIAFFAALVLAMSGLTAHASGTPGAGDSGQAHHAAGGEYGCALDAASVASPSAEQSSHENGCAAGHCAVPCGFLPLAEAETDHGVTSEGLWAVSGSQTDGTDLGFDPPPPRA